MRALTLAVLSLAACATPRGAAQASAPLAFIEDDFATALAQAKAKDVPLFVDAWAPW